MSLLSGAVLYSAFRFLPNLNANKHKLSSVPNQFCQISQCTFVFGAKAGLCRRFMCSSSSSTKKNSLQLPRGIPQVLGLLL